MLYVLIMAGGKGERFWPKSRRRRPKQLLSIAGEPKTLLQVTVDRARSLVSDDRIFVVTSREQSREVARQLPFLDKANIIKEPFGKNTASAVGLGAIVIERHDPEAVMVAMPTDHIISAYKRFSSCIRLCSKVAEVCQRLVTIGIKPSYPATGYGYIEIVQSSKFKVQSKKGRVFKVKRFVEKPTRRIAERFLNHRNYLWNSGIFVWKVSTILKEIGVHLPKLSMGLKKIRKVLASPSQREVMDKVYRALDAVSIDYGVMEKTKDVLCVTADFAWDDVGSWAALERLRRTDKNGNVCLGGAECIDTKDSIIVGTDDRMVAAIGIENLIIVSADDATLVCNKGRAEDVKALVEKLERKGKFKKYL